ncbi:conserved hypothetical protein [Ricinus communis]|uniref:Uncharacterized protein n=1 Tax=Ricinus communis TaxID=3988 RepID=B9TID4_RICCO|nr:conserved hypothetical protein [Ricinus communis]
MPVPGPRAVVDRCRPCGADPDPAFRAPVGGRRPGAGIRAVHRPGPGRIHVVRHPVRPVALRRLPLHEFPQRRRRSEDARQQLGARAVRRPQGPAVDRHGRRARSLRTEDGHVHPLPAGRTGQAGKRQPPHPRDPGRRQGRAVARDGRRPAALRHRDRPLRHVAPRAGRAGQPRVGQADGPRARARRPPVDRHRGGPGQSRSGADAFPPPPVAARRQV